MGAPHEKALVYGGLRRNDFRVDLDRRNESGDEQPTPEENATASPVELPAEGGFLSELLPEERVALSSRGTFRHLEPGEILVEQGKEQDSLYVLLSGRLRVSIRSPFSVVDLGEIQPRETVGEMNVIDPLTASATVRADKNEHCHVWGIKRPAFERFLEESPRAGVAILRWVSLLLTRRVRKASDRLIRAAETAYSVYEWD